MNNKLIAMIGSNGYIGKEIVNVFKEQKINILEINRTSETKHFLDLEEPEDFNYQIFDYCEYMIFVASISSPDMCVNNFEESFKINVVGTKYVIEEALSRGCKVIFLSSDAVYGSTDRYYDEDSNTEPDTAYGLMKKEVEDYFKGELGFKSIRLSYVISKNDKFSIYLENNRNNNMIAEVFHPFYRNCIMLNELIETIIWLIKNWNINKNQYINVVGSELISRVRLVDEINRLNGEKIDYKIIYPDDNFFKNRPRIVEVKSLYMKDILDNYDYSFAKRLERELKINSEVIK